MEKKDYGQLIKECNVIMQGGIEYSLFNYVSGIEKFDKYLNGKPFSATDNKHTIAWYEHAIVFYIFNNQEIVSAAFPRSELLEIIEHKDAKIEVFNVNFFTKLKHGKLGSGLVGGALFKAVGVIGDAANDKLENNKSSKTVDGSIFEFIFNNKNKEKYTIKVSCEKVNLVHTFSFLIYQGITKPTESSTSGACYIATVCYGDDMSLEVIKFREFRDKILKNHYLGRKFIRFYYNYAEALSKRLMNKKNTNNVIKILILNPLFLLIKHYLYCRKL